MDAETRKLLEELQTFCEQTGHATMTDRIAQHLADHPAGDFSIDGCASAVRRIQTYLAGTVRGTYAGVPKDPVAAAEALIEAHKALRALVAQPPAPSTAD